MQLALLRDLLDRRHEAWQAYYVHPQRLVAVLTTCHHPNNNTKSSTSTTDRFVALLDDQVDKAVVFFLNQQGQIARDLWSLWQHYYE